MSTVKARLGVSADRPNVIGAANDDEPVLVEATGFGFGMHKGAQRWVTGDGVDAALTSGLFIQIDVRDRPEDGDGVDLVEQSDEPSEDDENAAALEEAHFAYDSDEIAGKSIPDTVEWIGSDLARAEVVEARESAKGDDARKGLMEAVSAMLEADST